MPLGNVFIGKESYTLHPLIVENIMAIAGLPEHHLEQQLTVGLGTILNDSMLPLMMTVQERYAIFLKFLKITTVTGLDEHTDPMDFYREDSTMFSKEPVEMDGVSVRHLIGVEVEALEIVCKNRTADWILGAMALQIGCDELPALPPQLALDFTVNILKNRMADLQQLKTERYNQLYPQFLLMEKQLHGLVDISFDRGFVLNRIKDGGADDAPVRFRIDHAITGYTQQLLQLVRRENTAVQPRH